MLIGRVAEVLALKLWNTGALGNTREFQLTLDSSYLQGTLLLHRLSPALAAAPRSGDFQQHWAPALFAEDSMIRGFTGVGPRAREYELYNSITLAMVVG